MTRIGRFRIVRELGRGAIGTVYLGHDPIIDRSVAIKILNSRLPRGDKKKYEQQFINEARAAGRLSHPNIVTIYDASVEDGTTYIAMEYLQGKELDKLLDSEHRFVMNDIAVIILRIADALNYAHKNGVIHRDIKPANIFLIDDDTPKVVDFGIARAPNRLSDDDAEQAYTLFKNNLLGTPNYMSPEQAMGRQADHRSDIYSLGIIMYEMLTGTKPFKSRDTNHLLQQIAFKVPTTPHLVDPQVPIILSNIAMMAMNKRAEKRYQSAQEMVLDLRRYLSQAKRGRQEARNEEAAIAASIRPTANAAPKRRLMFLAACAVGLGAFGMTTVKRRR
ncbi:serine/threonine-protein kinase [Oxalobacteraceae bacterium R-40]|uniref:Serine/threonine-protein kinase n=1 Tax=Keguizhuia sedimenti TaxID=3064264 RepID=A0ABU1BMQ4_9BURK|nr:serine/threonine-protein kinase [Oxalobacteraceae bacterium R-40]